MHPPELHLISYVVWGGFMLVLSLALYDRLKAGSPAIAQTATAFGLIWAGLIIASGTLYNVGMANVIELSAQDPAQAATVWLAISSVFEGLSGIEVVGSTWILLVSWAALRGGTLPKALNYLGLAIGVAGLLTVVPALEMMAYVSGQVHRKLLMTRLGPVTASVSEAVPNDPVGDCFGPKSGPRNDKLAMSFQLEWRPTPWNTRDELGTGAYLVERPSVSSLHRAIPVRIAQFGML